jgi:hypothetical protein
VVSFLPSEVGTKRMAGEERPGGGGLYQVLVLVLLLVVVEGGEGKHLRRRATHVLWCGRVGVCQEYY